MADPDVLEEVAGYAGFGEDDARLLAAMRPHVEPALDGIVDRFYAAIAASPGASRAIRGGPEQVARLRGTLRRWLLGVLGGVYDRAYFEQRARIGRVHVRIELEQRYMFSAMSLLREGLHGALDASSFDPAARPRAHLAIDRICDIELAVMLESYRDAYIERIRATERAAATEAMTSLGTLAAALAHEIRNPLNAAKLQLELVSRTASRVSGAESSEKITSHVRIVQAEIGRLSKLLEEFLSLARPHGIDVHPCELRPLFEEVVALEAPVAERHGAVLHVRIDEAIPRVRVDRPKVVQVVVNLVANAIDAVAERGHGVIEIAARPLDAASVEVSVRDDGPGLLPEVARDAFLPFVSSKPAGTGLGLAIVKKIVEQHGGEVSLGPADGGGTIARFTVPRAT